jgi:hypothetical protein
MPVTPADRLRARATSLRSLARRVQQLEALTLATMAGTDVWMGPSPAACHDALHRRRTQLLNGVDDLMVEARRLERLAGEMVR